MQEDLLDKLIQDAHGSNRSAIRRLLSSHSLTDTQVLRLVARRDTPSLLLEEVMGRKDWTDNVRIRSVATRNPRLPLHVCLQQLKHLGILDLLSILRDSRLSVVLRKKVEAFLVEKIPGQPLGIKKTLARMGREHILRKLMEENHVELGVLCLNNPYMTEGLLYRVIFNERTSAATIRMVSSHPKWNARYNIRLALLRNPHTPLQDCVVFLAELRRTDLRDALADRRIHPSVRIHVRKILGIEEPELSVDHDEDAVQ